MLKRLQFKIQGVSPLLMHNGQSADPNNFYARAMKEITSKRKKTDADYLEMSRIEWYGSLYLHRKEPCIPSFVFEAMLIGKGGAARSERQGKVAAAGVFVIDHTPLIYDGPRHPDDLWNFGKKMETLDDLGDNPFIHQSLVRVQQSRLMRTRPVFNEWTASPVVEYDKELVDEETVKRWVEIGGYQIGLMDFRPRFGRFEVESAEEV